MRLSNRQRCASEHRHEIDVERRRSGATECCNKQITCRKPCGRIRALHAENKGPATNFNSSLARLIAGKMDATRLLSSAQVSGSYLLALACAHGGRIANFDRRLVTD